RSNPRLAVRRVHVDGTLKMGSIAGRWPVRRRIERGHRRALGKNTDGLAAHTVVEDRRSRRRSDRALRGATDLHEAKGSPEDVDLVLNSMERRRLHRVCWILQVELLPHQWA